MAALAATLAMAARAQPAPPSAVQGAFQVEPLAERTVARLPDVPLYWRTKTFRTVAAAEAAAGPLSLAAEHGGRAWLFTLGPAGGATPGGTMTAAGAPRPVRPPPSPGAPPRTLCRGRPFG